MITSAFIVGLVFYSLTVCLLYSSNFKNSPYYYWVGLVIGLITSSLWLFIAKQSEGSNLYVRGLIWDCMIIGTYVLIPALFFDVRLTLMTTIGCVFIVIGMLLTKV